MTFGWSIIVLILMKAISLLKLSSIRNLSMSKANINKQQNTIQIPQLGLIDFIQ